MFIGSQALIGFGIILVCILLMVGFIGYLIFSELYAIRRLTGKMLKLYTLKNFQNNPQP